MGDLCLLYEDRAFPPNTLELPASCYKAIKKKRKLWKKQIRRCFEVYRFSQLDVSDELAYKEFRLWIKRRLIMENAEFLESFAPGDERKAKLHELYEELENEYRSLINKLAAAMPAIQGGMSNVSFFQAKHF